MDERFDVVNGRFDGVNERLSTVNGRFNELEIRTDRTDSLVHKTFSEMVAMSADFSELKVQLKEHLPCTK